MPNEESRQYLTPTRAFLIALSLVTLALSLWFVGIDAGTKAISTTRPNPSSQTLTESEAIGVFRDLNGIRHLAYRHRDVTLIEEVYVPGTKSNDIAHSEITKLLNDDVIDKSKYTTREIHITSVSPDQVVLVEIAQIHPRFEKDGVDVTQTRPVIQQRAKWTLRKIEDVWLIQDGVLMRSQARD